MQANVTGSNSSRGNSSLQTPSALQPRKAERVRICGSDSDESIISKKRSPTTSQLDNTRSYNDIPISEDDLPNTPELDLTHFPDPLRSRPTNIRSTSSTHLGVNLADIEGRYSHNQTPSHYGMMTMTRWSALNAATQYANMGLELQEGERRRLEYEAARIGIPAKNEGIVVNLSYMEHVRSLNTDVNPVRNTMILESEFETGADSALKRCWDEMEDGEDEDKDMNLTTGYSATEKGALERSRENTEDNGDEHFYKAVKEMIEGMEPVLVKVQAEERATDLRKARMVEEAIHKNFCFGRALKTKKVYGRLSYC